MAHRSGTWTGDHALTGILYQKYYKASSYVFFEVKNIRNERRVLEKILGISVSVVLVASFISMTAPPAAAFTGDCSDIAVRNFKGAVFVDKILGKKEKSALGTASSSYVSEHLGYMKMHGINFVRIPYYWEAYVNNPTEFMKELEHIAKAANSRGMCLVFSNFHYYTSSYWNLDVHGKSSGRGFPSFVVDDFPKRNNDYEDTAGPFWNAFLSNNIWVKGQKVWAAQWDFMAKVINKVKGYNSVAGFEILNEPHLFKKEQYEKLGNYHTYMAKKIRSITDKKIFFDRETTRGIPREPSLEHKIVPDGVSRLVYSPQLYAVPTSGSVGLKQINNFEDWSNSWKTEVLITEWAADTKWEATTFLKAFKNNGFGWTYYAWRSSGGGLGGSLYDSDSSSPTSDLLDLKAAVQAVY